MYLFPNTWRIYTRNITWARHVVITQGIFVYFWEKPNDSLVVFLLDAFLVHTISLKFLTINGETYFMIFRSTSGEEVLLLKQVDRRCQVQSPVTLVVLSVRRYQLFSMKVTQIRIRIPQKDPQSGPSFLRLKSLVQAICLNLTTKQSTNLKFNHINQWCSSVFLLWFLLIYKYEIKLLNI